MKYLLLLLAPRLYKFSEGQLKLIKSTIQSIHFQHKTCLISSKLGKTLFSELHLRPGWFWLDLAVQSMLLNQVYSHATAR